MEHQQFSELMQLYLDGEIEPLEKILLEEHLIYCFKCREELNQLKLLDWELNHPQENKVPAELAVRRIEIIKNQLFAEAAEGKEFEVKDVLRLQLQIFKLTSGFINKKPVNKAINRSIKRFFTVLGKAAGASLKKRNPLLGRFIPGQA